MNRKSVHAKNYSHNASIPTASRRGPMLASSVIVGFNPGGRTMPETAVDQVANVFAHVGDILEVAGGTWDDVLKMSFYVGEASTRDLIEAEWLKVFTDADSMPARMTQIVQLRPGLALQGEFWAYILD